jgi:Ulp1 family protease
MSGQFDNSEAALASQLSIADIPTQSQPTSDSIILTGNNNNIQSQHPLSPPDEQKLESTTLEASDTNWITSKSMPSTPFTSSGTTSTLMFSADSSELKSNPANTTIDDNNSNGNGGVDNASQHVQESMHLGLTTWDSDNINSSSVCCYYDVVLRSDDLQLLSPGRWLNDTWIEFFYE